MLCSFIAIVTGFADFGNSALTPKVQPAPQSKHPKQAATPASTHNNNAKPASKSPVRNQHFQLLPDLVVERIWMNKGAIAFRLKNAGRGPIPADQYRRAKVKVGTKVYSLAMIDPHGLLKQPGRLVTYTSARKSLSGPAKNRVVITVFVDCTHKIHEQNEGNNRQTIRLAVPSVQAVKTLTASGITAGTPKKPGRRARSQHALSFMPVISIEKIFLDHGTVHVRLKNKGKTGLPHTRLRPVTLHLFIGKTARTWHLADIDRGRHLRHPGGSFDFDTGIRVNSRARVNARLVDGQGHGVQVAQALKPLVPVVVTREKSEDLSIRKAIRVVFPNGGELWERGKVYTIRWKSTGTIGNVKIKLNWGGSGGGSHTVTDSTPNTGRYSFRIPETGAELTGNQFKIQVMTLDESIKDESNKFFTIRYPENPDDNFDLSGEIRNVKIVVGGGLFMGHFLYGDMLTFEIWVKERGTRFFNMVPVVYRLRATRDNLVILQREVGFTDVYPDMHYSATIRIPPAVTNPYSFSDILIEMEVDPHNTLHEKEKYRSNNKAYQMAK